MNNSFKTWSLAIIMAMLWCCRATAIDFSNHNITVGVKGGATLSKVNFQSSVQQTMLPGFMLGGSFRYIEENHFGLIAELNLEQRGWKEDFKDADYSYSRRLTYLQVPLLTHIYFGGEKARFFVNAGPEIGFMISSSTSSNFDYAHAADDEYFQNNYRKIEQFTLPISHKFDYGISAGLGAEFNISKSQAINLEGRFYYGLNDIFNNHKTDPFQGSASMSVMVMLGYNFRLK